MKLKKPNFGIIINIISYILWPLSFFLQILNNLKTIIKIRKNHQIKLYGKYLLV